MQLHSRQADARHARGLLLVGAVAAALAGSARPVPAQPITPAPTPSSAALRAPASEANANSAECTVPSDAAFTVRWYPDAGAPASGCSAKSDGSRKLETPGVAYAGHDKIVPGEATIASDLSGGLTITFTAKRPDGGGTFHGFGTSDGVPFRHDGTTEDRFAVLVRPAAADWRRATPFAAYVNPLGTCSVDARSLDVDARRDCTALVNINQPKKDDKHVDKLPAACVNGAGMFCGRLTVKWSAFGQLVTPGSLGPGAASAGTLELCTLFTDREVSATAAASSGPSCRTVTVSNQSGLAAAGQRRLSYSAANGSSGPTPAPAAASPGPGLNTPSKGALYDGTGVLPLSSTARASAALNRVDVASLLDRLQQNFSAAKALLGSNPTTFIPDKGNLGCPTTGCPDDSFAKLDAGYFDALHAPLRTGVDSQFLKGQIELKPVDFSKLPTINYGVKAVGAPLGSRLGLAWARDIDDVATASAFHAEHDFGATTLGLTHVVANIDPAHDANVYRTDTGHTTNTVLGASVPLLDDRSLQFHGRYGVVGRSGAHDVLGVFSYSPTDGGPVVGVDGLQRRYFGAAGYRTIDAAYDPLATAYDQFVGTRSLFATAGLAYYGLGTPSTDPAIKVALTAVRAWDSTQPRYSQVSLSALTKLGTGKDAFSLSLSHTRSDIAASVFVRAGATVKIDDAQGRVFARNDADSLTLGFKALKFDFAAGPTWSNAPTTCTASARLACPAKYAWTVNYSVKRNDDLLFVDASMDLAPKQQAAFDQKSVASNQVETKGVLAYQAWCTPGSRYQPALTYDSNISQDGSSYLPGHLVEARLDIGGSNARHVFRVGYKLVLDQSGTPVSQSQHGLYFGIASDGMSEDFRKHCSTVLQRRADAARSDGAQSRS